MATTYYTSDDIIESVKRKISIPINQNTFTEDDILDFANEEMMISQVPSVMVYHEEFFTATLTVPLESGKKVYDIPERAIGRKIRDLYYVDDNNNEYEMTQIMSDDRAHFSDNYSVGNLHKFYFRGDQVVLVTGDVSSITGSLRFDYYLRPNILVQNERAAISISFVKDIVVDNTTLVAGDTVSIGSYVYEAGTDFVIGANSIETATNLTVAINSNGEQSADNGGSSSTNTIRVRYDILSTFFATSNTNAFTIPLTQRGIEFDNVPDNISEGSFIDYLQTRGGHRTLRMSTKVPVASITGNIITFEEGDVPTDFVIGDYLCSEYECIIPQIPDDLHSGLSERICARILSSLGDMNGLKATNEKISEIEARQGTLLDNRGEGTPQKVLNTHSLIRYGKRRRFTRRH